MSREKIRVYFLSDDPAALWEQGDTADDLGPETPGSNIRLLKLDHYDDLVAIVEPYERGLIARIPDDEEEPPKPPGFSDAELDEYLDSKDDTE
jgi:hypothetical protein